MAFRSDCSLLLGAKVQLIVSYTAIEAQVVFEMLLMLIASQLTIVGQLREEVYLQRIGLFLMGRKQCCWKYVCLVLEDYSITSKKSFTLLLEGRLESLLFHLPGAIMFVVIFLVTMINSHC